MTFFKDVVECYAFAWNSSVPAGVYAVRLDAGEKTVSRLMTVCE